MKAAATAGLVLLATALGVARADANDALPFLGRWEYRQANPAAETGYDAEGEILDLQSSASRLTGVYFGLERMGEEGLFYSAVRVTDIVVASGRISFVVPGRDLFSQRPRSVEEAERGKDSSSGFTTGSLKMVGTREGNDLVLECTSEPGECPDRKLVFRKVDRPMGR